MAGSKQHSDENINSSDILERSKETHGTNINIDENTPLDSVKAPNVFERTKEEIEALIQTIQSKKESQISEKREAENGLNPRHLIERAKEEIEAMIQQDKSTHIHDKETHGRNDDINESTPIDEIKGPSIFQRAKEEFEALVETIHHTNKESNDSVPPSPEKERGFVASIGRGLEKVCSPVGKGLERVCDPQGSKKD